MPPNGETGSGSFDFSVLRTLRKREKLTLDALSRSSGVSSAVISKLERNQHTAALDTLQRLGAVFRMTAADLIALAEQRIVHRVDQESYQTNQVRFQRIRYANASCFFAKAAAGEEASRPEIHHDDYEICWVLKGRIELQIAERAFEVAEGQAVQFDAIQEHRYRAREDSEILMVHLQKRNRFYTPTRK